MLLIVVIFQNILVFGNECDNVQQELPTLQALLSEAIAIVTKNREIIERITKKDASQSFYYELKIDSSLKINVTEVAQNYKIVDFLSQYECERCNSTLEKPFDLFNDQIDWEKFTTWGDIVRLNDACARLCTKFEVLADKPQVLTMAATLKRNLERLRDVLVSIETKISDGVSRIKEMEDEVVEINKRIEALKRKVGVRVRPRVDSLIVSEALSRTLTDWYPGAWKLLWRGSRDGFGATTFHSICDGKGPTVTVIRSKDGWIFGGYASRSWATHSEDRNFADGGHVNDAHASLFTLKNPNSIPPTRYFRVTSDNQHYDPYGLHFAPDRGPSFAAGNCFVADRGNENSRSRFGFTGHGYSDTTGLGSKTFLGKQNAQYAVDEVEVFSVSIGK